MTFFLFDKKSGLSVWFGTFLQDVLPKNKVTALVVINIFCAIGTEVHFLVIRFYNLNFKI
jgi:hypothetical protein